MYEYKARITRVIDGDTVQAQVALGFHLTAELRLRLNRIDTPETDEPDPWAAAKSRLIELIEQNEDDQGYLRIRTEKDDAFGRWLAELYAQDGTTLNDTLLAEGYAVEWKRK